MNSMLSIVALSAMAALCWGCCTPDQWEGIQMTSGAYAGIFRHGMIKEYNHVAYDATGKRNAVFMTYVNGDIEAKLQIVVRYGADGEGGMLYVENLGKRRCWKKALKREFRKACIPKDAKKLGTASLGLKGGFEVTSFESDCPVKKGKVILTVQPVKEGVCAPVGELIMGRMYYYDIMNVVSFFDITPGIKNATVFDVPKDCSESWDDFEHPPMRDADISMEFSREMYTLAV